MQYAGWWAQYDKHGRMRQTVEGWSLYALFAMETSSIAHVKIGISSHVYNRIILLRTGIPFPIGVVLFAYIGSEVVTRTIETQIHRAFASRREAGEWFRFDLANPVDKELFHGVTSVVYGEHAGRSLTWKKITPEQLNAFAELRQRRRKQRGGPLY